ncbi:MAG: MazG-like family protein [Clostridiales bacterium]|jgi:hypothetical protein|nr:MazG-like family protein [Clostridiales bacterium]
MAEIDITKNIRLIELLKSDILSQLAGLYEELLRPGPLSRREERLSRLIISCYVLSKRISGSYEQLDEKIADNIRLILLDDKAAGDKEDFSELLKHIENRY